MTLVLGAAAGSAQAQDEDAEDNKRIQELRREREDMARSAADSAAQVDALRADDAAVAAALVAIEEYVELQRSRIAAAEASIEAAEAEAEAARREAEQLVAEIEAIRERLRQRAIEVFVQPPQEVADQLSSSDFSGSAVKLYLLDHVVGSELESTDDLRYAEDRLEQVRTRALEQAALAESERASQVQRLDELRQAEADAERLGQEILNRISDWEATSAEIEAADREIGREIAAIEAEIQRREQERIRREEERIRREEEERRRAIEEARRLAEAAAGPFQLVVWPARGKLTSGFGLRVHPIFGTTRAHNGIDIDTDTGDPVLAARSGEVILAGTRGGYGKTVVLYHGLGYSTLYGHLSRISVSVGQDVSSGDRIGDAGSTGWSTGPHLHFELRIDGKAVNPIRFLP